MVNAHTIARIYSRWSGHSGDDGNIKVFLIKNFFFIEYIQMSFFHGKFRFPFSNG